ncbi:hypothetical protein AB4037_23500 [Labrys sp. KB_33_2]|uniref:hypothetical protein n=1 Tax=Labrys sp. KB_33_2 TaxID=3237479 RepID=UPI003F92CE80
MFGIGQLGGQSAPSDGPSPSPYDPAAQAFFDRAVDPISDTDKGHYNTFFTALTQAGCGADDFDFMWLVRTGAAGNAALDLWGSAYTFTPGGTTGSPVFIPRVGYDNQGVTPPAFLNTNFFPSGTTKLGLNSGHIGFYRIGIAADAGVSAMFMLSYNDAFEGVLIAYKIGDNPENIWAGINSTGSGGLRVPIDNAHYIVLDRTDANTINAYGDGSLISSNEDAVTSLAAGTAPLQCMGSAATGTGSQDAFALFHGGRSLGAAKVAAINAALVAYVAAVHP